MLHILLSSKNSSWVGRRQSLASSIGTSLYLYIVPIAKESLAPKLQSAHSTDNPRSTLFCAKQSKLIAQIKMVDNTIFNAFDSINICRVC